MNSFTSKNGPKEHEEICNNHDSCRREMPKWIEKILKYNPGEKPLKEPFEIHLDLECLFKKEQSSNNNNNNLEESYTEKKLNMSLLVGQYLQDVHLINEKINLIITDEKIVLKNYVKS